MPTLQTAAASETHEEKSQFQRQEDLVNVVMENVEAMEEQFSKLRTEIDGLKATNRSLMKELGRLQRLAAQAKASPTHEARLLAASTLVEKVARLKLADCEESEESEISTCSTCDGARRVHFDDTSSSVPCPDCRGEL
jgi:regulator of replication initiation timing